MEALLGGLGLGGAQPKPTCDSIFELQDKLRNALHGHVTETRADFVTETFEIRSNTVFEIPVTEGENEALENVSNIDPSLGGVRASVGPTVIGSDGQPARRVNAIDAVVNQPADDNAVQKLVAGHITTSLGQIDGSQWVVRLVSRTDQGWTFSYICKNSWQSWSRQASKTPAKTVIGEWSEKGGQDPVHLARPAFDCRGCLKIFFLKSSRAVEVKYEHSPLHKTVGQLIELLAPPPVAPVVKTPAKKAKEPKAPRPPREPRPPKEPKAKTPRSRKRPVREDGIPVDGQASQLKKRRKKKDSTASADPYGVILSELPGALPVGDPSERQLYNNEVHRANGAQPNGDYADPAPPVFNLPPGELERRRDVANKLLTDAGIDPQTLSTEQFNIFANQSPDLQKDSLAMLVKYGAERLRIVHPTKDGSSSEQSTPSQSPPVQVPASNTPKKRSRNKKSEAEQTLQPEEPVAPVAPAAPVYSGAAEGKKPPRGVCDNCRTHKPPKDSKCDKARPVCQNCLAKGWVCHYSHRVRGKESNVGPETLAAPSAPQQAPIAIPDEESEDLGSPGFHTESAEETHHQTSHELSPDSVEEATVEPVVHDFSHQIESPSDTFSQAHEMYHHSSGLTFPQTTTTHSELAQPSITSAPVEPAPMGYITQVPEPVATSMPEFTYPEQHNTVPQQQHTSLVEPRARPRRSVPTSQPSHASNTNTTSLNNQTSQISAWSTPTASATAMPTRTSPRQHKSKRSAQVSQGYDDLRQQPPSAWTSANRPTTAQPTQPVHTSPYQAAAQLSRAKSRQSNRSQTPVNNATRQPQPTQSVANTAEYSTTQSAQQTAQPASTSTQGYNYNQYSTTTNAAASRTESSNDRIGYQPYSNTPAAPGSNANSFSNFDKALENYSRSNHMASSTNHSTPVSQNVASSYTASSDAAPSTTQWGTASTSQNRTTHNYNTNNSYTQQSQGVQGFNMRPQPPAMQTRSSTATYAQQSQQHQQQQAQRHQQQQQHSQQQSQQHQQQSYNTYSNQPQHTTSNQQSWYGFQGGNSASSAYNSATAAASGNAGYSGSGESHAHGGGHGHSAQHQRSMNLSSHTYSSIDGGEQVLYDLLRNSPVG